MAQLKGKFIENNAVDGSKARLNNNQALRARNAADSADIDLIKLNASDIAELPAGTLVGGNAIATTADIPATFRIQGNWNANTNTPTLADGVNPIDPLEFPLYIVSVAGNTDLDGFDDWQVGDKAYFANGQWYKADNNDPADTDFLSEGSTNLYFTDARARTAAVVNSTAGSETDQAPSVDAIKSYIATELASVQGADSENEVFTLIAGDITNQYVDLGFEALVDSVELYASGLRQEMGLDYTLAYTGGAGSVTRVTFANDLATSGNAELIAGDKIEVNYLRA